MTSNGFNHRQRDQASELSLGTVERCELAILSDKPLPYTGFQRQVKAIMDLLTLVVRAPAGVLRQRLIFETSDERLREVGLSTQTVELVAHQIHQPLPTVADATRAEYLFTLDDVDLADLLPRWLRLHEQAWLACAMLFGLRYIPDGYTQSRLMASVTVAEAMHRELYPDSTPLSVEQLEALLLRIRTVTTGNDPQAKAERQYVNDNLRHNRLSCKERLLRLAEIPDEVAVAELISDVPRWAKFVRDARDGVAHASRDRLTSETAGIGLYALEVNIMLVSLVLMAEIGVSGEVQRRAVRSGSLHYIIREFNRALTGSTYPAP